MPNPRVPAAATGLPEIDRRAAFSGAAALLATACLPAPAKGQAAAAAGASLRDLIEAHKAAYARFDQAVGVRNEIEEAVDENRRKNQALVPLGVMPNGECQSGYYDLAEVSPDEVRKGIRDTHDSLRRIHCSKWSRVMFPELAAAAERELEASQARALQALAEAEIRMEEQEHSAGLTAAQEAVGATENEEFEARLSLVLYVPRNPAEVAAKREYIEKSPPFLDGWCHDQSEFVDAMIARLGELASAGGREA